jgi:hypothetical protein
MDQEDQGREHGSGTEIERALEEVREAQHELEKAHRAEELAEEHVKKAVHDLEEAEHDKRRIVDLIINTRAKPWSETTINYDQVVALAALPLPQGQNPGFTIIYEDGPGKNPSGTLIAGQSVHVKNEMVFHVTPTNRS